MTPPADLPPLPSGITVEPGESVGMFCVYDARDNFVAAMWSNGTVTSIAMHPDDLLAVLAHLQARAGRGET